WESVMSLATSAGVRRLRILRNTGAPPQGCIVGPKSSSLAPVDRASRRADSMSSNSRSDARGWHGASERVGGGDDLTDRGSLFFTQARVPDVTDQDDPDLIAVVPGLVLDRIVEHPRLAQ